MLKPLFDTTVTGWSGQTGLNAISNDAMQEFAQRLLAKQLLCKDVIAAVQACNRSGLWGGLGRLAPVSPRSDDALNMRMTARLWSVISTTRGRVAALSVMDQSGQMVGQALSAPSGAAHHAHISLSLADPNSGTVIGAVVFELDAAQF